MILIFLESEKNKMNVRYYSRLLGKGGLFDLEKEKKFIVAEQIKTKKEIEDEIKKGKKKDQISTLRYYNFPSSIDFNEFNLKRLMNGQGCSFFEVYSFDHNKSLKLYFDMDLDLTKCKTLEEAEKIKDGLIDGIFNFFNTEDSPFDLSKLSIYTTHRSDKFSYHIVLNGYTFRSFREVRDIAEKIISLCPPEYIKYDYVDLSVYKSIQQFRLINNHKKGVSAIKTQQNPYFYKGRSINSYYKEYEHSLITSNKDCIRVDNYIITPKIRKYTPINHEIEDILKLFKEKYDESDAFELRESDDEPTSLIALKRIKPSYCKIHDRTHENDHAYITIHDNSVFYHCYRGEGNIFLGQLGDIELTHKYVPDNVTQSALQFLKNYGKK